MIQRKTYCLGSIDIPFKLHVRDPRKCKYGKSESYWSNKELGFVYDRAATCTETFMHRVGKFPPAKDLIGLMSRNKESPAFVKPARGRDRYNGNATKWTDLDTITFHDTQHAHLLNMLARVDASYLHAKHDPTRSHYIEDKRPIAYKTSASFSAATGEGTVKLHLYVREEVRSDEERSDSKTLYRRPT